MNKLLLEQIEDIRAEKVDLERRLELWKQEKIPTVSDSIQTSSKDYPYTKHNTTITGYSDIKYKRNKKNQKKYKKLIEEADYKIEKLINELEYEMKKIEDEDSDIRKIIRHKYEDNMNYVQIAHKMNKDRKDSKKIYTEESVRKQLKRFLKKL